MLLHVNMCSVHVRSMCTLSVEHAGMFVWCGKTNGLEDSRSYMCVFAVGT